jgi:hypothetical protein
LAQALGLAKAGTIGSSSTKRVKDFFYIPHQIYAFIIRKTVWEIYCSTKFPGCIMYM